MRVDSAVFILRNCSLNAALDPLKGIAFVFHELGGAADCEANHLIARKSIQ